MRTAKSPKPKAFNEYTPMEARMLVGIYKEILR